MMKPRSVSPLISGERRRLGLEKRPRSVAAGRGFCFPGLPSHQRRADIHRPKASRYAQTGRRISPTTPDLPASQLTRFAQAIKRGARLIPQHFDIDCGQPAISGAFPHVISAAWNYCHQCGLIAGWRDSSLSRLPVIARIFGSAGPMLLGTLVRFLAQTRSCPQPSRQGVNPRRHPRRFRPARPWRCPCASGASLRPRGSRHGR